MGTGSSRNQLCRCGSGVKQKKCCQIASNYVAINDPKGNLKKVLQDSVVKIDFVKGKVQALSGLIDDKVVKLVNRLQVYYDDLAKKGYPSLFDKILDSKSKGEQQKIVKNCSVSWDDFNALDAYSQNNGSIKHEKFEFVFTTSDEDFLNEESDEKFQKLGKHYFHQKKTRFVDIYTSKENRNWFSLYYTDSDIDQEKNHWEFGPHFHFTSNYFTKLDEFMGEVKKRTFDVSNIHVKLKI